MPWLCCTKFSSVDETAYIDPAKFDDQILLPTASADRDDEADMQAVRWIRSVSSMDTHEKYHADDSGNEEDLFIFNHDNSFDQGDVQSQGTLDYTSNHATYNHESSRSESIIPNPLINIIPTLSEDPIHDINEEQIESSGESDQIETESDHDLHSVEPFEADFKSQESLTLPPTSVDQEIANEEGNIVTMHMNMYDTVDVDGESTLVGRQTDSHVSSKRTTTDSLTNDGHTKKNREAAASLMKVISPASAASIMERDRHANEIIRYDGWQGYQEDYRKASWSIIGTSLTDEISKPHVLSPPLLEALQGFLPVSLSTDNFWMRYSLVRDVSFFFLPSE